MRGLGRLGNTRSRDGLARGGGGGGDALGGGGWLRRRGGRLRRCGGVPLIPR